ncbi:TetR/AcrR family transcriptional regulator [Acinetobacter chinensis]|uniref:TetR/AcrR family transcriptional regulator n=1 Tax=Acinetobacter chinensis TaxID=2004650 RepID=A0A3B7LU17_9GAMM|nr:MULTISPECIES: TetR/AcrR family transcriptional regulator [Acinetobacter]AXY55435.1 TetR/AcrR family transcriptional regulator [Acinetobacter chinensis]AXY61468.1 TetR/AcrR family transcriptional regulator [Acinetobacter sp. WCHAc010052]MDV2470123.1 TetR/AcrR family transcriptional regulator [Acinetobacter chinensis]WOE41751.1 TetR/AcrR family transcriptional regulator [Acinetobacter chinensis]
MRKQPQQKRARLIVDNILEATQLCIAEHGLLQVTTPKIAEKSGVSVGSIYQYFENKEEIVQELLRRKSENLGLALKQLATAQEQLKLEEIIPLSIQFGFDMMKADDGFFIEILKHWHGYNNSEAAQILEKHFFEVGLYVFNRFFQHWNFETLKNKSFVIINSTLFTMMRYVSNNSFLISEQQLKKELTLMILAYLSQD